MRRRFAVSLTFGLVALAGGAGLLLWPDAATPPARADARGVIEAAPVGGPFTLTDQDGKPVTEASWPGKYLLVFFGYRWCPDFCPTELDKWGEVLKSLGPDADKVQPLFVTVDPQRDTSGELKQFTSAFDPRIVGLTGTEEQIKAAAKAYRVYFAKSAATIDEDKNYLMDHSTYSYFMAPDGRNLLVFSWEAEPDVMVDAIRAKITGS